MILIKERSATESCEENDNLQYKMNDLTKKIQCVDKGCGEFEFSDKEQSFYAERGYSDPKRCKQHREARKKVINKQNSPFHPKNWKKENRL